MACSREGQGENRDNGKKVSHLRFHRRLKCDGRPSCLLKQVGDPPSLGQAQHGQKFPIPPCPRFCAVIPQRVHGGDTTNGIVIGRRKQAFKIM